MLKMKHNTIYLKNTHCKHCWHSVVDALACVAAWCAAYKATLPCNSCRDVFVDPQPDTSTT